MPSEASIPQMQIIKVLALSGVVAVVIVAVIFPSFFSGLFSSIADGSFFQNQDPGIIVPENSVQNSHLTPCPYECCNADGNFAVKSCDSPKICELNECVDDDTAGIKNLGDAPDNVIVGQGNSGSDSSDRVPSSSGNGNTDGTGNIVTDNSGVYNCPFECCEDELFDEKLCSVDKICVNNECINQDEI